MQFLNIILLILLWINMAIPIKRSRGEGLNSIYSSNTLGAGDIWLYTQTKLMLSRGLAFHPGIGGAIGLADFLSVGGSVNPYDPEVKNIGNTVVQLKLTYPNNKKLRLFGVGLLNHIILPTRQGSNTQGGVAEYVPRLKLSALFDIDWMARYNKVPFKFYLNLGNVDDDIFLNEFDQLNISGAIEYKGYFWSCGGLFSFGTYDSIGFSKFPTEYTRIHVGGLVRIRIPILGADLLAEIGKFLSNTVDQSEYYLTLRGSLPLYYLDTDAEAVRTFLYIENRGKKKKIITEEEKMKAAIEESKKLGSEVDLFSQPVSKGNVLSSPVILDEEDLVYQKQMDLIKQQRKEFDVEMKKLEELLEE